MRQNRWEIRHQMTVAAHRNPAQMKGALACGEFDFLGEVAVHLILMRLPFPKTDDGKDVVSYFGVDRERIALTKGERVDFLFDPFDGIFREDRGGEIARGLVSENQAVFFDIDAHVVKGMRKRLRFTQDHRLTFGFLKGSGIEKRPFAAQGGVVTQQLASQTVDPVQIDRCKVNVLCKLRAHGFIFLPVRLRSSCLKPNRWIYNRSPYGRHPDRCIQGNVRGYGSRPIL